MKLSSRWRFTSFNCAEKHVFGTICIQQHVDCKLQTKKKLLCPLCMQEPDSANVLAPSDKSTQKEGEMDSWLRQFESNLEAMECLA